VKQKLTLSIDKDLLEIAKSREINLSELMEFAIMNEFKIKKIIKCKEYTLINKKVKL